LRAGELKSAVFRLQHRYAPYVFVAPFVLVFFIFMLYPLVNSLILAFYVTSGPKSQVFVGFANFVFLLQDPDFHTAIHNTVIYASCSVFLQLPLSLGLAMLLNQARLRGRNFFRLGFFSPNLVGQVFVAVLFSVIFIPKFGLLNRVLHALFEIPIDTKWLGSPELVMPALVLTSLWMYVGFNMIYFLAALQTIDVQLYEAADVDGASPWQKFLHVTVPGIRPVAVFVIVLSTIGSFQLFELPYVMLESTAGPDNAGLTIVMYLYQNGWILGDLGFASAIGWMLTLGVFVISLVQMGLTGSWKTDA
jgi:ABC-type sugar transport system permease subunit|tara:strand:- start:798 stop:1712 length:915 start_codon:yes stop_codon:yes gene_type:complete